MDNFSTISLAGLSKLQQTVPADASPDLNNTICLDDFDNIYTECCLHKFCFRWQCSNLVHFMNATVVTQPFDSIFPPSVRQKMTSEYVQDSHYNGSFATLMSRRSAIFNYDKGGRSHFNIHPCAVE